MTMISFLAKLSIWLFGARMNKNRQERFKRAIEEDDVEAFERMLPRKWRKELKKPDPSK